jgi:hypothetical protein
VNASKTQAIYFTRCWSPRRLPGTRIVLIGQEGPWSSEVKYLLVSHDSPCTCQTFFVQNVQNSGFSRKSYFQVDIIRKREYLFLNNIPQNRSNFYCFSVIISKLTLFSVSPETNDVENLEFDDFFFYTS